MAGPKRDDEGFINEETAGDLEGDFIEPAEGLQVKGVLERAFATSGEFGLQACYAIRGGWSVGGATGAEGVVVLIGEKAFFKNAVREQKLGSTVKLTFKGKEPLMRRGKDGKEKNTGQSMWRGDFASKRDGEGVSVRTALARSYQLLVRPAAPVATPDAVPEVPF